MLGEGDRRAGVAVRFHTVTDGWQFGEVRLLHPAGGGLPDFADVYFPRWSVRCPAGGRGRAGDARTLRLWVGLLERCG